MGEEGLCLCAPPSTSLYPCQDPAAHSSQRSTPLSHVLNRSLCQQQDLAEEGFAGWGPAVRGQLSEPFPPQDLTSPSSCHLRIAQSPVSVPHPGPVNSCGGGFCQTPKSMCVCVVGYCFQRKAVQRAKLSRKSLGWQGEASAWALTVSPAQTQRGEGQHSGWHVCGRGPQGVAAVWPGGQNPRTRSLLVSDALRKRCPAGGAQPRRRMAWGMAGAEVSPDCTTRTAVQHADPDVRTGQMGLLSAAKQCVSHSACPGPSLLQQQDAKGKQGGSPQLPGRGRGPGGQPCESMDTPPARLLGVSSAPQQQEAIHQLRGPAWSPRSPVDGPLIPQHTQRPEAAPCAN